MDLIKIDVPEVSHMFSDGVYARTIHMKANSFVVGKRHRTRHLNIVTTGAFILHTEDGNERIEAPYMFESDEGVQKVLLILEDTDWTTIHVTKETDLDTITQQTVYTQDESMKYFEEYKERLCLGE